MLARRPRRGYMRNFKVSRYTGDVYTGVPELYTFISECGFKFPLNEIAITEIADRDFWEPYFSAIKAYRKGPVKNASSAA